MKVRNAALPLIWLILGVSPVCAQIPESAPTASAWTLTPTLVSQYMLRGARLGGPSFEPNIEYDSGALCAGVWTNFPLRDKVAGQSDPEVDPYGSYTFDLVKDKLTFQPGFTLYTYPNANRGNGFYKATFEPTLTLNWMPADGWKFTPKLYRDVVLKQTLAELNISYAAPLKDLGTELDFLATAGTFRATDTWADAVPAVKNWGSYWLVGVTVPVAIVKDQQKLLVGVAYTEGTGNYFKEGTLPRFGNSAAVGRAVISLGYAIAF